MKCLLRSVVLASAFALIAGFASVATAKTPAIAPEFGQSLPPVGFVKFCVANPTECKTVGRRVKRAELSPKQWATLYQVNALVNSKIAPISDQELYGEAEFWTYPVTAGDCEDYLLLKKRYLEQAGFDAGALLITVVLDENKSGHAVLTIASDAGDYILDNRRNDILLWNDTGYDFLKRQSRENPRQWQALTATKDTNIKSVSGN